MVWVGRIWSNTQLIREVSIREYLRRHPQAHLDETDRQVDELLQNDFVEPAASQWASNVVLVKKKDGSFRLCVDYRRVNSVTYKDSYPLPHIDTSFGSMNGAVWLSTLDLRSGYHNIPSRRQIEIRLHSSPGVDVFVRK